MWNKYRCGTTWWWVNDAKNVNCWVNFSFKHFTPSQAISLNVNSISSKLIVSNRRHAKMSDHWVRVWTSCNFKLSQAKQEMTQAETRSGSIAFWRILQRPPPDNGSNQPANNNNQTIAASHIHSVWPGVCPFCWKEALDMII